MATNIKHSIKEILVEQYSYISPPPLVMVAIRRIIGSDNFGSARMHHDIKLAINRPKLIPNISDKEMEALTVWWSTFRADWHMASLRYEYYHNKPPLPQESMYSPQSPPIE